VIVVPSIAPASAAEAVRELNRLSGHAALAEVRLDYIPGADPFRILRGRRPPVIVTYRSTTEGGRGRKNVSATVSILREALSAGAEFIDVEERLGGAAIAALGAVGGMGRIILSRHGRAGTPSGNERLFRRMAGYRPAIVKFVSSAESFGETTGVLRLLRLGRRLRQPTVAIAMGEYGVYTRVLQGALGGALSFAAPGPLTGTAPGQLTVESMEKLYRAASLGPRTKIFGLVGDPVSYSRGTEFHNAVFARAGRDAVYVNFLVDDLDAFMSSLSTRCSGLSVTMPFKTAILPWLDLLHPSVSRTGSANTLVRRGGKMVGLNTDYMAILSLLRQAMSPRGKSCLVIGTGGAARSAAAAGAACGVKLIVAGRRAAPAKRLADRFGGSWVTSEEIPGVHADIIVNATPVGMSTQHGSGGRIVPRTMVRRSQLVCDFANPPDGDTALIGDAKAYRRLVISGEEIFRLQAGLQSSRFLRAGSPP